MNGQKDYFQKNAEGEYGEEIQNNTDYFLFYFDFYVPSKHGTAK